MRATSAGRALAQRQHLAVADGSAAIDGRRTGRSAPAQRCSPSSSETSARVSRSRSSPSIAELLEVAAGGDAALTSGHHLELVRAARSRLRGRRGTAPARRRGRDRSRGASHRTPADAGAAGCAAIVDPAVAQRSRARGCASSSGADGVLGGGQQDAGVDVAVERRRGAAATSPPCSRLSVLCSSETIASARDEASRRAGMSPRSMASRAA